MIWFQTGLKIVQVCQATTEPDVNEDGEIYLGASDHIEVYDFSGNLLKSWESPNEKTLITSIAISESSVFVADAGNKYVHRYNSDGEYQNHIGRKNKEKGWFLAKMSRQLFP